MTIGKNVLSILLCLLLIISCTACKNEDVGPITVTVAIESDAEGYLAPLKNKVEELYNNITIEWVTIPDVMDDTRNFTIQQMRTEIMAGKGPDVFLLPTGTEAPVYEPLFINVEESMRSGLFLPLNDLILEAEFLNMENHFEVIMNSGKLGDDQLVLPLLYDYSVNPVDKNILHNPTVEFTKPQDIIDAEDYELLSAIARKYTWFEYMFGNIVDYDRMKVTISEEEIAQNLETAISIFSSYGENYQITSNNQSDYECYSGLDVTTLKFISDNPDFTVVQMPNSDGGLTATITAFAAINRNSEHPNEAFKVIELLYSYETLNQSGLRAKPIMFDANSGIATGKDYYGEADLINTDFLDNTSYKINAVRFKSEFDELLLSTYIELQSAVLNNEDIDVNKMASDIHWQMQMMISE